MQQSGMKDVLDRRFVKPYRHHRCTPVTRRPRPSNHQQRQLTMARSSSAWWAVNIREP
jgi:hypothetical protein